MSNASIDPMAVASVVPPGTVVLEPPVVCPSVSRPETSTSAAELKEISAVSPPSTANARLLLS